MEIERYKNESDEQYIRRLQNTITNLWMSNQGYESKINELQSEINEARLKLLDIRQLVKRIKGVSNLDNIK